MILAGGSSHTPKIAQRFSQLFPETTPVHAPATDSMALNPAELAARGAALQASLVAEFDVEDIEQSTHPVVTVAPHLSKAIGVIVVGADGSEQFQAILPAQTAVPARRIAEFSVPADGGDVVIKFVEGASEIRKTVPEKKPKAETSDDDEDDEDDDEEEEEEEEEIKTKHMKVEKLLAEALLKDVKKGQKIEVTVQASVDTPLNVAVRIVGTQQGIRGVVSAP